MQIPHNNNTAIIGAGYTNCYGAFPSNNMPSLNNCWFLGYPPKIEETESSSTITTVPEIDGKFGRDETTDSISCKLETDPFHKKNQTNNMMAMRVWYEKCDDYNSPEPELTKCSTQKKKAKETLTVEMLGKADLLRQDLLLHVFRLTGRSVDSKRVLKLTARHEKEKIIRFNEMCLRDTVIPCIESRYGLQRNHFPLCIDKCPHSPVQVHRLCENTAQWVRVQCPNLAEVSQGLKKYISSYSNKQTRGQSNAVVKYSDLRLNAHIINNDTTQCLVSQQNKVKIMKGEYFNKIRTATPKAPTQPLNLTYARFWVEIVKDCVYLSIMDVEALKAYDEKHGVRRPIKSAIGAYVDGRMEIELAIMSSFTDTEIGFEWYVHRDYISHFQKGITVGLHLTGNKELRDWSWYETVKGANVLYSGYEQWPSLRYGPFGAPFSHSLLSHSIQPFNNSYTQNWNGANYGMQVNIGLQQPANYDVSTPTSSPVTMAIPSPALQSIQDDGSSSATFNSMEADNKTQKSEKTRLPLKRKRHEMEHESNETDSLFPLPLPLPKRSNACHTYLPELTPLEGDFLGEEQDLLLPRDSWYPELDPFYNKL